MLITLPAAGTLTVAPTLLADTFGDKARRQWRTVQAVFAFFLQKPNPALHALPNHA